MNGRYSVPQIFAETETSSRQLRQVPLQTQVVDMGSEGPLRCSQCKAYVNPFMQFHSYGKSFTCNFCSAVSAVPPEYQENIGIDGRRRDADERPELCRGSVEFIAPPSFSARFPALQALFPSV